MSWRKVDQADKKPGVVKRGRNRYEREAFDFVWIDGDGHDIAPGFVLAGLQHIYVLVDEVLEG